jgi:hypothetical protein
MPSVDDLKSSNFITQKDVDPPVLATIDHWEKTNIAKEGAEPEMRFTLHFKEFDKPMTLNVTNGNLIASIVGSRDFDSWAGQVIVLYRDPSIMFAGEMKGGIRVRAPKPGYTANQQAQEPERVEDDVPF